MRWPWALAALALGGCAYYNGLFNANRLAHEARRAEREGRTSEARSLWSRAAVKAESVATRHKRSKYRDDALFLQGFALFRLGSCSAAIEALRVAADSSPDRALGTQARLLLGRCWLVLEAPDSVLVALRAVADSGAPAERDEALLLRGQARMWMGDDAGALDDLARSEAEEARYPRAAVLARLGRTDEAAALLGGGLEAPYVEERWLPALDTVGLRSPALAADLVDRLVAGERLGPGPRARLLLADGERWQARGDTGRAVLRFRTLAVDVPDSAEGQAARVHLAIQAMRVADRVSAVRVLLDSLQAPTRAGGPALRVAGRCLTVMTRVEEALGEAATPLQLFLAAEDTRDSLGAPALAAALFAELEQRHGMSVVAPKALLALADLRPQHADSLVRLMETRYPESVYTLALRGAAGDRYRAVEDSLRRLGREAPTRRGAAPADPRVRHER